MSILSEVKEVFGITDSSFDKELIGIVNSVIGVLVQFGVDSFSSYDEIDEETDWPDQEVEVLPKVAVSLYKAIIFLKTRLIFDPPANTNISTALERSLGELESRLCLFISEVDMNLSEANEPSQPEGD
jgi:hypothetical protein